MEILHIFSVTGNKNRKIWQEMEVGGHCGASGTPPLQGKANGGVSSYTASPARGRVVVTFFYKPIDIVGFMCYHALTYKKDMLKE